MVAQGGGAFVCFLLSLKHLAAWAHAYMLQGAGGMGPELEIVAAMKGDIQRMDLSVPS